MTARRISFAALVAVLATCAFAAPALAAPAVKKPYSLVLSPATIPSGSEATVSATYTNLTDQQQLGSSNLTAPAGYTVTSAQISGPATATATVVGDVVQLRGLSTPPGASVTVQMTVSTDCAATTGTWTAVTKQANDFNGPPGNDLTLDASRSSTTTTTSGGCRLVFSTQPKDVQAGSTITGIVGDPAGPPVAVSVLDGAGNLTDAAISITVGLGTAPAGAVLDGTKTVTSSNGVATFGDLSVDEIGTYTLVATSPQATSATSDTFKAYLTLVPCFDNTFCTADAAIDGTVPGSNRRYTNKLKVDAPPNPDTGVPNDGGALALSFNGSAIPDCPTYAPVSPDTEVVLGPNRVKTVTSTIAKSILDQRRRSATSLQTCLIAPYQFNLGTASGNGGQAQSLGGDVDGDGHDDYVGLLPNCNPVKPDPPCQVSAGPDAQGNGVVVYLLPADPRDPLGRH